MISIGIKLSILLHQVPNCPNNNTSGIILDINPHMYIYIWYSFYMTRAGVGAPGHPSHQGMASVTLSSSSSYNLVSLDLVDRGASLPLDVMFLILHKLFEPTDHHVRFNAVCKGWNSLAKDYCKNSTRGSHTS